MEVTATCPYCGEPIEIDVDEGGATSQRYVEDCSVCCRPFEVRAALVDDDSGEPFVELARLDE
jgi:Cysteine-rich CPXCG